MHDQILPLVSICIPVYNCETFINQAIESALSQTYKNIELIILDNASTDLTPQIVNGYHDPRIRYIRNHHNIGMRDNWNKALIVAEGEYIKLLPADDILFPTCIQKQVEKFLTQKSNNLSLISCSRDIINQDGDKLMSRSFDGVNGLLNGVLAVKKIVRSGTNLLGEPGAILFCRDRIENAGVFVDKYPYVIDLDFWIKMLSQGNLFVIHESLCSFRVSKNSESNITRRNHSRDFSEFIRSLPKVEYQLTTFDILIGTVTSICLEILRRLFYRISSLRLRK